MTDITMAAGTFRLADVFSKSFAIYTRRFVPFIILTVIASIPNYIAIFAIGTPGFNSPTGAPSFGAARVILGLVDFATKSFVSGAVMYGVIQDLRGRTFSVGDSVRIALRRFLPMLGVVLSTAVLIVLGTALLIVPGLMLACMYYVSMPACVAENTGVFTSMSRSGYLTKGYRWQVFGTFLLMLLGGIIIGGIVGAVFALAGRPALLVATQVAGALVGAFNGVLVSVFYYELRVAKEGVDIEKIAGVFD
jgi:hypothetical protein